MISSGGCLLVVQVTGDVRVQTERDHKLQTAHNPPSDEQIKKAAGLAARPLPPRALVCVGLWVAAMQNFDKTLTPCTLLV